LTELAIPASVASIGAGAFGSCADLIAITVDSANAVYSSQDGVLFNQDGTRLLVCPPGRTGEYAVPAGTQIIWDRAFPGCANLTRIEIPDSVFVIGFRGLEGCNGLTRIILPGSIRNLDAQVFRECQNLAQVYFRGNAPDEVGWGVFDDVSDVTICYLPDTTGWGDWFADRPALLWNPAITALDADAGNGFAFRITGTTNIPVEVHRSSNLPGGGSGGQDRGLPSCWSAAPRPGIQQFFGQGVEVEVGGIDLDRNLGVVRSAGGQQVADFFFGIFAGQQGAMVRARCARQNDLRPSRQADQHALAAEGPQVFIAQGHASAAGNHHPAAPAPLRRQLRFHAAEGFLAVFGENTRNAFTCAALQFPVHLEKRQAGEGRDPPSRGALARAHETQQHEIPAGRHPNRPGGLTE